MKLDRKLGPLLLISGTLTIRSWWRWVPLWVGQVYARRWWQVRGVIVGVFRWSYYIALVRER